MSLFLLPTLVYLLLWPLSTLAGNWNTNVRPLVVERLDPIVSPNGVASHMHDVIGGSAFGASYNYADALKSSCTSFPISVDKSNYWMPKLYWINQGGTSFTPLTAGHRVYYFRSKSSPAPDAPNSTIQAFPPGLRMLAGSPNAKTPNTLAINMICRVDDTFMGPDDIASTDFNFARDCPRSLLVQIKFPSCWDGASLYKADQSHMSYPVSSGATWGSCPWTHPIRLPSIMLEYYFSTSQWAPGQALKGNLAWANGDTTGYGAHADFTNGWDVDVLQKALNDPTCDADADMTFQSCPVFAPYVHDAACSPDKGRMDESTGNADLIPVPTLPGCNPLWASGTKPTCSVQPSTPDVTRFTGTDGSLVPATSQQLVLPTTPGWQPLGCIQDTGNMLLNETRYSDANLTQATCFDSCLRSGYSYAAVGKMWGTTWDCHCGSGVSPIASVYPRMCNATCPGNSSQLCGGSSAHQVFYAPAGTKTVATFSNNLGCYADPAAGKPSLELQASYNFTSWDKMSTSLCLQACADRGLGWGMVRAGSTCYCGSNDKFALGSGNWVSADTCSTKCTGNATESCGYYNGATVFNTTLSGYKQTVINKPPGYLYCFSGGNTSLTGTSFWDATLTPQRCSSSCYELGYPLAAVWNANTCMCGKTYQGGGQLPMAMCSGKCPGNATLTCGAQWNIGELYNTSAQATSVQGAIASRPAGWQGCYANGDTLLPDFVVSDSKMTIEKCLASCDELGYPFAGVQSQSQCRCAKTGPTTSTVPVASLTNCNVPCNGNASETCGGWGKIEVYKITPTKKAGGTAALPGYQGCFNGTTGLSAYKWTDWNKMTIESCTKGCRELGYSLSSVTQATCSCGNAWAGGPQLATLSCNLNCTGNVAERCGGWPTMSSVYSSAVGAAVSFPAAYKGCYNDSLPTKILTGFSTYLSEGSSVTSCRAICSAKGYALAGSENANSCYCGDSISAAAVRQTSDFCASACPGDATQKCGAWNYASVYATSGNMTIPVSSNVTSSASAIASASASVGSTASKVNITVGTSTKASSVSASSTSVSISSSSVKSQVSSGGSSSQSSSPAISTSSATSRVVSASASSVSSSSRSAAGSNSSSASTSPKSVSAASSTSTATSLSASRSSAITSIAPSSQSSASRLPTNAALVSSSSAQPTGSSTTLKSSASVLSMSASSSSKPSTPSSSIVVTSTSRNASSSSSSAKALSSTITSTSVTSSKAAISSSSSSSSRASSTSSSTSPSSSATVAGHLGCFAPGNFVSQARNQTTQAGMTAEFCRRFCSISGSTTAALSGNTCSCGPASSLGPIAAASSCTTKCSGNAAELCGSSSLVSAYSAANSVSSPFTADFIGCFSSSSAILDGPSASSSSLTVAECAATCHAKGETYYGLHGGSTCQCGKTLLTGTIVPDGNCVSACSGGGSSPCGSASGTAVYAVEIIM